MKKSFSVTERNKAAIRRFEIMINTNDKALADELICADALFQTPVSPTPLKGGRGIYPLSILCVPAFPMFNGKRNK